MLAEYIAYRVTHIQNSKNSATWFHMVLGNNILCSCADYEIHKFITLHIGVGSGIVTVTELITGNNLSTHIKPLNSSGLSLKISDCVVGVVVEYLKQLNNFGLEM